MKKVLILLLNSILVLILSYSKANAQGQVISNPDAGTICTAGQVCYISWYIYAGNDDIRIEYKNGAGSWITIVDLNNVSQAGDYPWVVPGQLSDGSYKVRIGQAQNGGLYYAYWSESPYFQINGAPRLEVIQPGAGLYTGGQTLDLEVDANVNYQLKLKNQNTQTEITAELDDDDNLILPNDLTPGNYTLVAHEVGEGNLTSESSTFEVGIPEDGVYTLNFVRTKIARVPARTIAQFEGLAVSDEDADQATETISYSDGLGRVRQSISYRATSSLNHMVSFSMYDEIGQQTTAYQAYPTSFGAFNFRVGSVEAQDTYYQNPGIGVTPNSAPYSVTITDKSPLLTVKEQGAVGTTYQPDGGGRTIKTKSRVNNATDQVIYWTITTGGDPKGNGYYAIEEISITETTDEDGNVSEVFVNRAGHEVLKRGYLGANKTQPVETYYVYDKFGNLRFIIPPKAVESIGTNASLTLDENNTVRNNWLTEMRYDEYQRVIEKKIPEADWVYTVYDNLGRVALTQDGNMRVFNDWFFTKYDIKGRAIITGVYKETEPSRQSRQDMQAHVRSQSMYWEQTELQSGTEFDRKHGYSNHRVFPTGGTENGVMYWSITYYDDYDFNNDGTPDEVFANYPITPSGNNLLQHAHAAFRTDGMVTGSKTRILEQQQIFEDVVAEYGIGHPTDADEVYYMGKQSSNFKITLKPGFRTQPGQKVEMGSFDDVVVPSTVMNAHENGTWLEGVSFYDERGNAIYTKSTNHVGGTDKAWTLFTFDGLVAETYTRHNSATENLDIVNKFEYDDTGRLIAQYQNTNNQGMLKVVEYEYNELGQLVTKKLANTTGSDFLQTLNYTYHIRGWLESVNDPDNIGSDYFAYKLSYDEVPTGGTIQPSYNGSIIAVDWATQYSTQSVWRNQYHYSYDNLNQLVSANFMGGANANSFDTQYQYDLNGNMTGLMRYSQSSLIDNLQYFYSQFDNNQYGAPYKGNKVERIEDLVDQSVPGGFYDGFNYQDAVDASCPSGTPPNQCGPGPMLAPEYGYDVNGNMISDANKGISNITYNYMNLPEVITFSSGNKMVYTYDAAGTKLSQKTYPAGGGSGVITQYSGGFVYEDNTLAYFPFSEGRVRKVTPNITEAYRYEYDLTDHLGNVRATFAAIENYDSDSGNIFYTPQLLQADSYYPFGMKMGGYSYVASGAPENKFTYNGKELEDEFGLDWYHYGWRFYDPAVGRWWSVDQLDVEYSPYNYSFNSPIRFTDPDGNNPVCKSACDDTYTVGSIVSNNLGEWIYLGGNEWEVISGVNFVGQTASGNYLYDELAFRTGFSDYLTIPFTSDVFVRRSIGGEVDKWNGVAMMFGHIIPHASFSISGSVSISPREETVYGHFGEGTLNLMNIKASATLNNQSFSSIEYFGNAVTAYGALIVNNRAFNLSDTGAPRIFKTEGQRFIGTGQTNVLNLPNQVSVFGYYSMGNDNIRGGSVTISIPSRF